MNIDDVINKALSLGLGINGLSVSEIIKMIQVAEGNQPCFGTNNFNCPYRKDCLWAEHCKIIGHTFEVIDNGRN